MPYKWLYPRLKAGDAIDVSIPMHEEGCMLQAVALSMSLCICRSLCCFERVRSVCECRGRLSGGWASGNWGGLGSESTTVLNYSDPPLYARCAGKKIYGFEGKNADESGLEAYPGTEGWKDVLQLLREKNKKIEVLSRALSVIQHGMLKNNPALVKEIVNEATEMFKRKSKHP